MQLKQPLKLLTHLFLPAKAGIIGTMKVFGDNALCH